MASFKLYSYYRSSSAYRVRVALNLKSITFDYIPVHLVKDGGEQHLSEFRKLNPMGEVPVLVHENRPLSQSMAILSYLDEIEPIPLLFPKDPYEKAKVIEACEIINSGIQPLQNLKTLQKLDREFKISSDEQSKWAAYWILRGFESYEKLVQNVHGKFSFGNEVSAADLYLGPQVYNARRFNIDLSIFPIIEGIEKNCLEIEAFRDAYPGVQPDTPNE